MGITMGYTSVIYQPPEQAEKPDTNVSPAVNIAKLARNL